MTSRRRFLFRLVLRWFKFFCYFKKYKKADSVVCVMFKGKNKYFYRDSQLFRVEYESGIICWYENGVRHRNGGPAVVYPDGSKKWFRHGKFLRKE